MIQHFFGTWRFPVMMLSMLFFFTATIIIVLLLPTSNPALASFAEDFKVWCLRYDPATGEMEWGYVLTFLFQPLLLAFIVFLVWGNQLWETGKHHFRKMMPYIVVSFVLTIGMLITLTILAGNEIRAGEGKELPFPAERLRTTFTAPDFSLVNQNEDPVSLESLKGKVVLVTAVYAQCGYTCPMIFAQTKEALAQLSTTEKSQLTVAAITLDPEHDTPEILNALARGQQVEAPFFNLLTGEPVKVNAVLDKFGFSRSRDPETGVINHANLFILIDREGRVAYRFTLGERQQRWLVSALKVLINEKTSTRASLVSSR